MTRYKLLVLSEPVAGQDEQYREWYDQVHLPEVLELDGFVAAKRYAHHSTIAGDPTNLPNLAIYDIETDDIDQTLADMRAAMSSMTLSDTLDMSSIQAFTVMSLPDTTVS